MSNNIHTSAIVDPKAELAGDVTIKPFSIIGPQVKIDSGTVIGPHVVVQGPSIIGKNNQIFQFASVGEAPQDLSYQGEPTRLEIGDHNIIREGATIHRGTNKDQGVTKIGNHNVIMGYVHIAHDCVLGNHNILANTACLAGHVTLHNHVILSAFCAVHQFCQIGSYTFIARAALVGKDIPPYMLVVGGEESLARIVSINKIGLQRQDFSEQAIKNIYHAFKILCRSELPYEEAMNQLQAMAKNCPEVELLTQFINSSKRGILR